MVLLGVEVGPVLVADLPPSLLMRADSANVFGQLVEPVVHALVLP
jgi:hypothetical protein